eukprot:TRINITY_DN1074_c0_g1_i20.p1 TRINITY_DN1074_c0_g1~~TRINITY_DN1074_c0_g1_i20.p1  ORF type:complete len:485 (-),score=200.94 TRINITY_DN1074_c0_g1_i20:561-1904(-)
MEVNTTLNEINLADNKGGMREETWKRVFALSQAKRTRTRSIPSLPSFFSPPPTEETKKLSPEDHIHTLRESNESLKKQMEEMKHTLEGKFFLIEELKASEDEMKMSFQEKEKEKERENQTLKESIVQMRKRIEEIEDALEEKDHRMEEIQTRMEELQNRSVPIIQTSSLSFSPLPSSSIKQDGSTASDGYDDKKAGFLCHLGRAKVRVRMLNAEEWSKGVQKWFQCSQRHPFIPRVLGIVHKENIPLVEGSEHILPHLHDDVDGIAILDASTMGKFTLYDLLHGSECCDDDDDGHPLDLHVKSMIMSVLMDVAEALTFVDDELGMIHGSVNSHSILIHYSKEEGRFIAQLSEVGMWSPSMLNDDRIRWVAPEVIKSGGCTGPSYESDIWSFGMLMEEMLTGELPFQSETVPSAIGIAAFSGEFESHPPLFDSSEFEELMNAVSTCSC